MWIYVIIANKQKGIHIMNAEEMFKLKLMGRTNDFEKEFLERKEKFDILKKEYVNPEVLEYLKKCLQNLTIEFNRNSKEYIGNILYLMKKGDLNGWCWETTASAICFLMIMIVYIGAI